MSTPQLLDALAHDPLAVRLAALDIPTPDYSSVTAGSHARVRSHRRRALTALLAGAFVLVIALATTAVAAPGLLAVLSQDILSLAGLSPTQVTPVSGRAHHGSDVVIVSGAYADNVSTVVFAEIDLAQGDGFPSYACSVATSPDECAAQATQAAIAPYLMDQFGQRYLTTGGSGIGVGAYPIFFQPLRGRALSSGAQLTLHLPLSHIGASGENQRFELAAQLSGSLTASPARPLPMPPAVAGRGVTFAVLGLQSSGPYVEVHTRLSGQLQNVIEHVSSAGSTGETYPGVFLVDSSGVYHIPVAGAIGPVPNHQVQDETRIFAVPAGSYRIVVAQAPDTNGTLGGPKTVIFAQWSIDI